MSMGKVKGMGMPSMLAFHRELSKKGFDVTYIHVADKTSLDLEVKCEGVTFHHVLARGLPGLLVRSKLVNKLLSLPVWLLSSAIPLYKYFKIKKKLGYPMVIYGHHCNGAIMASILSKVLRIPNISRLYGSLLPFHFGFSHHYPVTCFRRLLNRVFHWEEFLGFLSPADAYVITNDGTLGDQLCRSIHGSKARIEFIRNGIDIDWKEWLQKDRDTSCVREIFGNDAPVVVTAARMEHWKRLERIIEVGDRFRLMGKHVNFLILGNGHAENKLRREIAVRDIGDRVRIKTDTLHKNMPHFLLGADVVFLCQDYTNLSNTLLETFVLERPVVVLNVGGTTCVAKHEENCLMISLENIIEDATISILRILDEPELRLQLAAGCRKWREEHAYSWGQRVEVDVKLINDILSSEKRVYSF